MKGAAVLALFICSACDPLDDAELTIVLLGDPPIFADGETPRTFELCSTATSPQPMVELSVSASIGELSPSTAGSDGSEALVLVTDDELCTTLDWIPPLDPDPLRLEARVDDVLVGDELFEPVPAVVSSLRPRADPPLLDASGASQLSIEVDSEAESGGSASNGTVILVDIIAREPADALVTVSDDRIEVGVRTSVSLYAPEGTSSVTVRARVEGTEVVACRVITATAVMAVSPCPP